MTRYMLILATGALFGLSMLPAAAQRAGGNRPVSLRPSPDETLDPARPAAPPALPGARSPRGAAPATRSAADMSPNEALFDAINRGDIAAVRDAMSRGADLRAQNVLGMTPMELSVDLGRNDISFLLLSMRDESSRRPPSPEQPEAARTLTRAKTPPGSGRHAATKLPVTPAAPIRTPVLFAGDGGAPVPAAGFLGFDTGRVMR